MNIKPLIRPLAVILAIVAAFMTIPAGIAIYLNETATAKAFIYVISSTLLVSGIALFATKNFEAVKIPIRESFFLVSLGWILSSIVGALPFYISGATQNFTDSFFETVSGFTTTGATVLVNIEAFPASLLFWRSLTHWLGGMGIVVLTIAILPVLGVGGLQLLKAEIPGPTVEKITPRIRETAKAVWMVYLGMTVAQTAFLRLGKMSYFDALTHTFGTLSTGGFSLKNSSIGAYNSIYIDTITTIFMILGGISFTVHYRLLSGKTRDIFKNSELLTYLSILSVATLVVTASLYKNTYSTVFESFRHSSFHVVSIMTTTGFKTADYQTWTPLTQIVLFFLMFLGGCSGSTSGGIKIIRIVTMLKLALNEMKYLLHPRAVLPLWVNGKVIKKDMVYSIAAFFVLYALMIILTTLVCASSGVDITTSLSTSVAAVNNIGIGFGKIGPEGNYAFFADYVKWFLSFAMVVGRLEIYSVLIIFTKWFWD